MFKNNNNKKSLFLAEKPAHFVDPRPEAGLSSSGTTSSRPGISGFPRRRREDPSGRASRSYFTAATERAHKQQLTPVDGDKT